MNKENKEILEEWITTLIGIFGGTFLIMLVLAWIVWLMKIFIVPQFNF